MRVVAVCLLIFSIACTSEPLDFPDWTIPVPEGTPIIEYAAVPMGERTELLELERDLVLAEAFGRPLYRPSDVDVARDGSIFVLDSRNHRVVVFDDEGTPLVSFGQEGQGPGELKGGWQLCLTSDRVVVYDYQNRRLSIFRYDGELVADHLLPGRPPMTEMKAAGAGLMLIDHPGRSLPPFPAPWVVGRYSFEGEQIEQLVEMETGEGTYWSMGNTSGTVPLHEPFPVAAFSDDGAAYVSRGDEYQLLAFDPDGIASWALRVSYRPPVPTRDEKDAVIRLLKEGGQGRRDGLADEHFFWPDRYAAIEGLETDGNGNLYVFPHSPWAPGGSLENIDPVPVDVYTPEGERLFSGMIAINSWNAALGDQIYRIETDPESEEEVVVRYRLVEPF